VTFARAIGSPRKADRAYQDQVWALNACVMCLLLGNKEQCGYLTMHHRTLDDKHGQLQLGHREVLLLGAWHHQGVLLEDSPTIDLMRERFGPSLQHHKVAFVEAIAERLYTTIPRTLALQELQDSLIEQGFSRGAGA